MVATALVAYAVPSWVDRKHAIVTSREGDRFSGSLTLLNPTFSEMAPVEEPSSRPLLAHTSSPARTGIQMSEPTADARPTSSEERPKARGIHQDAAREYAALKARRASRVSVEKAAAKRRMVTAGVGTVLTAVFIVLVVVGALAWAWVLLPVAFLGASLTSSVLAGRQAQKIAEAEDARMAELRASLRAATKPQKRSAGAAPQKNQVRARKPRVVEEARLEAVEVSDVSTTKTSTQLAESLRSQARGAVGVKPSYPEELPAASGGEWDYVPMPAALHTKRPQVRNRVVHTHTDIVDVRSNTQSAAVPGRPIRATKTPMTVEEIETSSNPTFRFDLDAVLDQRRAQ